MTATPPGYPYRVKPLPPRAAFGLIGVFGLVIAAIALLELLDVRSGTRLPTD